MSLPTSTSVPNGSPPLSQPGGLEEKVVELARELKPRLRGWLHAGMTPLAVAAGIVLVCLAPTALGVEGAAVFLAASVLLFGTSGIYHRFAWGRRGEAVLRRMDHANIYVFIAASYTPFALLLVSGDSRVALLSVVWGSALLGLVFRTCWLGAPRWLYTSLYLVMGWVPLVWLPTFLHSGGIAVVTLILGGGLLYTAGAVVYGCKHPNPSPRWFGFHEIFHACTVAAFAAHYVAISLVTYGA